mmetsp:Transcript_27879/g.59019  ORF Transcript_27879/g.59019 Transcript_27879/m.59019 type:complete len:240 (-) Transcript_27879:33-752(-)
MSGRHVVKPVVQRPNSFEAVVQKWDVLDIDPVPDRPLLLYGSSILRLWTDFREHWQPLPVINRAFGGARTWEALYHFKRAVARYQPRVVLFYCGSNDVNFHMTTGSSPSEAIDEIVTNVTRFIHAAGDIGAQVVVASIIKAPQKRLHNSAVQVIEAANSEIQRVCEIVGHAMFVDLNPSLEHEDGSPIDALYLPDKLHYVPAAYERMHAALSETVHQCWRKSQCVGRAQVEGSVLKAKL